MISFNNIPDTIRTPGVYAEIDNSRALKGLIPNPHKALVIGQKLSAGSAELKTLYTITSEMVADRYFGVGSVLDRMCRVFKKNNPNTEMFAIAIEASAASTIASGAIHFSIALSHAGGVVSTDGEIVNLMINGSQFQLPLTSGWSVGQVNSAMKALINANSLCPVIVDTTGVSVLVLQARNGGTLGNYIDFRVNYYEGQSNPTCFKDSIHISEMAGGATDPLLADVWAVIEGEQFQHIINPYRDATNLTSLENELAKRFKPLEDKQGIGYTAMRGPLASCAAVGNSRNSPHNILMGAYGSPTCPEEWAAAVGAIASEKLNNDPARPLHYLALEGILPPKLVDRFTREERDTLLYDGIATWTVDAAGKIVIERMITTYQTNATGSIDPSYLDIQTLATLMEIRYQFKARMETRFLIPRFKLADDDFPVQVGSSVVTPKTIKQEIISLFTLLRDRGLIENLDDFIKNLIVERDSADANRVNVLLPPDLINQFRIMAGLIQFIL